MQFTHSVTNAWCLLVIFSYYYTYTQIYIEEKLMNFYDKS